MNCRRPQSRGLSPCVFCLPGTGFCLALCLGIVGCAESSESPEVLVERGHLMVERLGKFDDAIDAYTKALQQRPNDATIYYDRGVAYGRSNRWQEAVED